MRTCQPPWHIFWLYDSVYRCPNYVANFNVNFCLDTSNYSPKVNCQQRNGSNTEFQWHLSLFFKSFFILEHSNHCIFQILLWFYVRIIRIKQSSSRNKKVIIIQLFMNYLPNLFTKCLNLVHICAALYHDCIITAYYFLSTSWEPGVARKLIFYLFEKVEMTDDWVNHLYNTWGVVFWM